MGKQSAPEFYSVDDVADALSVCPKTIRTAIKKGDLVAHRIGRLLRISGDDYRAYVAMRRGVPSSK